MVFLQPDYVTKLLKPFVDHRLGQHDKDKARRDAFSADDVAADGGAGGGGTGGGAGGGDAAVGTADPQAVLAVGGAKTGAPSLATIREAKVVAAMKAVFSSGMVCWSRRASCARRCCPTFGRRSAWTPTSLASSCPHVRGGRPLLDGAIAQGRRWIMPLRLPESRPHEVLKKTWNSIVVTGPKTELSHEQLGLAFARKIAPAGIVERLLASIYGYGTYVKSWKRGSTTSCASSRGLGSCTSSSSCARSRSAVEGRAPRAPRGGGAAAEHHPGGDDGGGGQQPTDAPPPAEGASGGADGAPAGANEAQALAAPAAGEAASPSASQSAPSSPPKSPGEPSSPPKSPGERAQMLHELVVETRGLKSDRDHLWALLLRLREVVHFLLDDFPGCKYVEESPCPGCISSLDAHVARKPTRWPVEDVTSRQLRCERCGEGLEVNQVLMEEQSSEPIPLQLTVRAPPTTDFLEALHALREKEKAKNEEVAKRTGKPPPRQPVETLLVDFSPAPKESRFSADQLRYGKPIEGFRLHNCSAST